MKSIVLLNLCAHKVVQMVQAAEKREGEIDKKVKSFNDSHIRDICLVWRRRTPDGNLSGSVKTDIRI